MTNRQDDNIYNCTTTLASHLSGVDEAGGDEDGDDDAKDGEQDEHADLERLQAVAGPVRMALGADQERAALPSLPSVLQDLARRGW